MLGAHVGVVQGLGLFGGQRQNLLHPGGVRDISARLAFTAAANFLFDLLTNRIEV